MALDTEEVTEVGPWEEEVTAEEGEEETDSIPTETMSSAECQKLSPNVDQ